MSWIHIDDYAAMMLNLLRDGHARGPYNMTAPQPVTNAEFTAELGTVLHRPAVFIVPAMILRLALGERACLMLEGQRVLPERLQSSACRFSFASLADALQDLLGR